MDVAAPEAPPLPLAPAPPRPSIWAVMAPCLGIATDPRKLALAAAGLVALWAGWSAIGLVFGSGPRFWSPTEPPAAVADLLAPQQGPEPPSPEIEVPRATVTPFWPSNGPPNLPVEAPGEDPTFRLSRIDFSRTNPTTAADLLSDLGRRTSEPPRTLMAPFMALFATPGSTGGFLHALLAAAWGVAVWGLVGGAIVRIAVVQLATGENVGALAALRFALGKAGALMGAPLSPLLGVTLLALPCAILGLLLYQIPGSFGTTIAGALAFVPLLIGVPLALLVLGLAAGWPLMVATVAAESEDGFDSLSRSYAYASQRPAQYAWSLAVAWALGIAGALAVALFAHLVIHLAEWSLAFGAPDARLHALFSGSPSGTPAALHAFWIGAVSLAARGWSYAFFWTAIAQIYLLLRRDVDGTPRHAIYQPAPEAATLVPDLPTPPAPTPAPVVEPLTPV